MNQPRLDYALGFDLGGSSIKAVVVGASGEQLATYHQSFDPERKLHFAETLRELMRRCVSAKGCSPTAIGLAAPGLASKDATHIAFMPGRLAGLEGLNWGEYLERPQVPVLNDAHAALLGEVAAGAARGATNVILLTLGTGVGGAAMVDGNLLRGHLGKAGHFGHLSLDPDGKPDICGTPGSLEDAIGNHNIAARSGGRFNASHELIQAHEAGDSDATEIWMRSVNALAAAIVSLGNILDPEVAIIGGGIARCGDSLFRPLRELVAAHEWKTGGTGMQVVPATLGEWAGAHGAAWNALRRSDQRGGQTQR
jgi:glucokinase